MFIISPLIGMIEEKQAVGKQSTIFIVQHMEDYLYEWCLYEYLQMKQYLQNTHIVLHITNFKTVFDYQGDKKEDNNNHIKALQKEFATNPEQFKLIRESVVELVNSSQLIDPICMLDMRGQKELSPTESWSTLVFGGILGDHPPRDRPAPVRQHFHEIRHLGDLQLATDTAVLMSRLILANQVSLKDIPTIREPTVKGKNKQGEQTIVQMEGFSYISEEIDLGTGQLRGELSKKEKKKVYMSEGVKNLLLQQDLAADLLM